MADSAIAFSAKPNFRSEAVGFLTDATLCIGCKACEVACKQWNDLPADNLGPMTGMSYDNTIALGAETWRHVAFIERTADESAIGSPVTWLMLSDVCKHCVNAACMEACPTGAIIRTEFDSVYIQPDICNGCGYCIPACPFGVPQLSAAGAAQKCTMCYDRLRGGLEPACAKACPTESIRFGFVEELYASGVARIAQLRERDVDARLYGDRMLGGTGAIGGLNALFVLNDAPETFNLPAAPDLPQRIVPRAFAATAAAALVLCAAAIAAMQERS
ncbi:MAG: 4Fe-4S dicluster domain-containing protein [Thermomicrobiales bacterium]|nr:4Fe-4S dicluster domain-containing protein [Thermomicrobiales bacterium]